MFELGLQRATGTSGLDHLLPHSSLPSLVVAYPLTTHFATWSRIFQTERWVVEIRCCPGPYFLFFFFFFTWWTEDALWFCEVAAVCIICIITWGIQSHQHLLMLNWLEVGPIVYEQIWENTKAYWLIGYVKITVTKCFLFVLLSYLIFITSLSKGNLTQPLLYVILLQIYSTFLRCRNIKYTFQ